MASSSEQKQTTGVEPIKGFFFFIVLRFFVLKRCTVRFGLCIVCAFLFHLHPEKKESPILFCMFASNIFADIIVQIIGTDFAY